MVIGSVFTSPVTVQVTLRWPPPPLPEPLHWLTVGGTGAPGVLGGEQLIVGSEPPPWPESTHCVTVLGTKDDSAPSVTLLMTVTLQITLPPPPLPDPSHCVTSGFEIPFVVLQVCVVPLPVSTHTVCVDVAGSPVKLFVIVTSQVTVWPPTLPVPLH